jgi:hypothetical protein
MTNDNILFRHKLQLVNAYRSARRTRYIALTSSAGRSNVITISTGVLASESNLKACGGIQFFARLLTVAAANLIWFVFVHRIPVPSWGGYNIDFLTFL